MCIEGLRNSFTYSFQEKLKISHQNDTTIEYSNWDGAEKQMQKFIIWTFANSMNEIRAYKFV